MISTRRGFQVSKHKHNGTAFINSSANGITSTRPKLKMTTSLPAHGEITFVNNGGDGRKSKRKGRTAIGKNSKPMSKNSDVQKFAHSNSHHRLSTDSSQSPSSASTSTSGDIAHEGTHEAKTVEIQKYQVPRRLPTWASYRLPHDSLDSEERLRFMALAFDSQSFNRDPEAFRIEHAHTFETSAWTVHDPTSLHCSLTLGALFDAIKSNKQDTPGLNLLASQLYSIVNRRVSENDNSMASRDITMRAVASLAIISGYQGKPDHWFVHMQGLLNLTELAGGMASLSHSMRGIVQR